ncbi:S8 family serine peptidase [Actinoallomurus vinaceus]|uniref:S8 family serine peptidase n=1 Tax=Actinoallomurus vinaceus TaxID=1080074 RepID=A0ABP8U2J0_9ACTN
MRRLSAGVAITLAGAAVAGVPAAAHATPARTATSSQAAKAARLPAGRSWKVTLVTGDVVQVRTVKNRPPLVSVKPGSGRGNVPFLKDIRPDGTVKVIPGDVVGKVGKLYDPALFDVTTLIQEGDDDAKRSDLPLIVQGGGAVKALAAGRTLHSLGATAVHQPKSQGPALARSALAGSVKHIWLDRKVHALALDHNLTQIGAPAAWKAGATGKGVKVAILDTGVDATHPDLKGRIAEQKNFSQAKDTVDRFGHGTHVAATIAGTGAAAKGARKGVAPDADLIIGKVLGDDGGGEESGIIAGMEWAAPKARIVSMSLGGPVEDPANDPLSTAVNDLTAKNNTLFVIAAGNDGPATNTVGTPGIAASALTVGAVDGHDKVADFSSRGDQGTVKPEISAPGVDIIAARAAGTSMGTPVDSRYTSSSGTSMATPHVAGAAADLLQKHPSWTAARLKAALVSTAHGVPGTVFQVGGGRLDVGAATAATVIGDQPAASFGPIPHGATGALTKQLSWTNTGAKPVTLKLAATLADRAGHAAKGLSVPASVTVPAGGSASAAVTLDPRGLTTAGGYSGVVTATATGVSLRTPVGAYAEPVLHTLTVKATALPGTPSGAFGAGASVVSVDDPNLFNGQATVGATGTTTLRVPAGRYAVLGAVWDDTKNKTRMAFAGTPEVSVTGDTTVTLDGAQAKPVKASAPGTTMADPTLHVERTAGGFNWAVDVAVFDGTASPAVYSVPTGTARTGSFHAYAAFALDSAKTVYSVLHDLGGRVPASVDYKPDLKDFARLDQRFGSVDGSTKTAVDPHRYGMSPVGYLVSEGGGNQVTTGSTRVDYVTGEPGVRWLEEAGLEGSFTEFPWFAQLPLRHYAAGHRYTMNWFRSPFHPGPYSATDPMLGYAIEPVTRTGDGIHVELNDTQNEPDGLDNQAGDDVWEKKIKRSMRLYADGKAASGKVQGYIGDFTVPEKAGTYRLDYTTDVSAALPISTKTSTTWTFRSKPGETRVPLLTVDYALPLDLLNHPSGDTATFTVARVKGSAAAKATGLKLWTSLDDGKTWKAVTVTAGTGGKYTAKLPKVTKGQAVSLRVQATDNGGGKIDQTIIRAYTGG